MSESWGDSHEQRLLSLAVSPGPRFLIAGVEPNLTNTCGLRMVWAGVAGFALGLGSGVMVGLVLRLV